MMRFSAKQRRVLTWWRPDSPDAAFEAIICDGAVRSGKTLCMGLSFFLWASACYSGARFGLCGKTIASLRRKPAASGTAGLSHSGHLPACFCKSSAEG